MAGGYLMVTQTVILVAIFASSFGPHGTYFAGSVLASTNLVIGSLRKTDFFVDVRVAVFGKGNGAQIFAQALRLSSFLSCQRLETVQPFCRFLNLLAWPIQ